MSNSEASEVELQGILAADDDQNGEISIRTASDASETGSSYNEWENIELYTFKECCRIKKPTKDSEECGCGRLVSDHASNLIAEAEIGEWNSEADTVKKPSASRRILFPLNETDGNRATPASYLRLADDTALRSATQFFASQWPELYTPDILISFLGGCGNDFISKNAEDALTEGLSQIINSFDCIFFTRASQLGLSKLVGRVSKRFTSVYKNGYVNRCIGFMPWGCVSGRHRLSCEEGSDFIEYESNRGEVGSYALDNNHHVFYLVDDGSVNRFGAENKFRSELHQFIVCEDNIANINLLVSGGLTSIAMIHTALFPDHKNPRRNVAVPVVILKNSGRAADVFAHVYELDARKERYKERKYNRYRMINLMLATKIAAMKYLGLDLTETDNLRALALVRECIEKRRNKVFICDVDKKVEKLHTTMLSAALEVSYASEDLEFLSSGSKFKLAVNLRDVELARKLMQQPGDVAGGIMLDALARCNISCVEDLLELYNFDVEEHILFTLVLPYQQDARNLFRDAHGGNFVIRTLSKEFQYSEEDESVDGISSKNKRNWSQFMNSALQSLTEENLASLMQQDAQSGLFYHDKTKMNATQAMMINCMMINHPPLTKVFWKYDKYNPLSNALLAFQLQSAIAELYDTTVPRQLLTSIDYFEEKIIQLLVCYYETDEEMAKKVLSRKIPMWKNQTMVDVAGDLELKFFIEQPATQRVLSEAWKGQDPERQHFLADMKEKSQKKSLIGLFYLICFVINNYLGSPATKIVLNILMYLISIGMFSFYILVKNSPAHLAIKWIMFVMVAAFALDELRQVFEHKKQGWLNIKRWASSPWNLLDAFSIVLFFTGFIASFFDFHFSKDILSVFLCIWCIKMCQFLRISSTLGPYMVMIFQMLAHIKTFLAVLIIAILGYGMFMAGLLFPNSKASWDTFFKVLFRPYLLVFGEMGLESHELSSKKTVFGTPKISRLAEMLVIIGMCVFLLLANVVLLNLLIAAFSNIYEEVRARSYQIWRFEQYELLKEFQNKPVMPFPYSIPENLYLLFTWRQKRRQCPTGEIFSEIELREISDFERSCMMKIWPDLSTDEEFHPQRKKDDVMAAVEKCKLETMDRIENIAKTSIEQKEQLRKRVEAVREKVHDQLDKIDSKIDERLSRLEEMILKLHPEQ